MKARVDKDGVYRVVPETMDEAFMLGAMWHAWRIKGAEQSVIIDIPEGKCA